ncbi:prolyl oligopeptidase family serine peptidase [Verrucomicrobiales bacterium]|jgi:cephalosporin-C deacetylase-like acetyl esterase|nr:prolyl oligopeptidase family serine peptidase [Verrucomicrobiales bacterium]
MKDAPNQNTSARRRFLQHAGIAAAAQQLSPFSALAEESSTSEFEPLNRFPRMVHNYYLEQVIRAERRGAARKAALKTKADTEAYVADVRKRIHSCFAPFPKKKSPLNAKIVRTVERETYDIEILTYESRPGFIVTANLYLPKDRSQPLPAVVGTCGHSTNGKAEEAYQSFAQGLARLGYICLIYDPIGQGERSQYLRENGKDAVHLGTRQHNLIGNQQTLIGEFFGTWRAWDGMCALDYLLTRPEVDPKQIGVTGNSGGGTMTTWLCGVEPRWSMAAPSCFVTTWRHNMENELPQDSEQCPPRALANGLDHDDFLAAMAPKPVMILPKEKDYFDIRGSFEAHSRLKKLYALLGAEENIALKAGPTPHGFTQENRESMYRWFNQSTGGPNVKVEPEITIEKDETLWCCPDGQVAKLESRTVFDFTAAKAKRLSAARKPQEGDALKETVRKSLRMRENDDAPPHFRNLRPASHKRGYPTPYFINYAVETEPGIQALVTMLAQEAWASRPPQAPEKGKAIFYVSHHSADAELRDESLIHDTIEAADENAGLFAVDVRGVGESLPGTTRSKPLSYYGPDYFYTAYSNMLGRPYIGGKTYDILRVIEWLASFGYNDIHLVAKGWGTVPATFAALLSPAVKTVTLKNALSSYEEIATTEQYGWPNSIFIPGVLKSFDLPDCYEALKSKQLTKIEPFGPTEEPA